MTQVLPKWEMRAYSILWNKYGDKEFYHDDVCKLLKQKKEVVSTLLYDMRKAGWVEVGLSSEDTRKRVYRLKAPELAVKEMVK